MDILQAAHMLNRRLDKFPVSDGSCQLSDRKISEFK